MYTRLALLATTFATIITLASPARAQSCATVEIENVRPQQGQVMLAAFNSAESFGKTPLVQLRVPAGESRMSVQLCGLSGAAVAITAYQDLDGDGKMGKNLFGLPTEPWGGSGKPGGFGPSWDTGKVALDGKPIAVRLSQ